jgi:hypothetical protein
MEINLQPNEFFGLATPYGVSSYDGEILVPGCMSSADKSQILLCDSHQTPIGICVLHDTPKAMYVRGRVCTFLITGKAIMTNLHKNIDSYGLCLSTGFSYQDTEKRIEADGKEYLIIRRASPVECSFVPIGDLPETKILGLGPLETKHFSDWDKSFADPEYLWPAIVENAKNYYLKSLDRLRKSEVNGGGKIDEFLQRHKI